MNKFLKLFLCLITPLIIGGLSGVAAASGLGTWQAGLQKPFFNPPSFLFGPVWTSLYLLMGISLYLILQRPASELRKKAIGIFVLQMILNFCWSFIFFKFQMLGLALIEIIALWLSILMMIRVFKSLNPTSAWLQIPYLMWVSFATVLNASIWYLNL